jgi:hypothetical protein
MIRGQKLAFAPNTRADTTADTTALTDSDKMAAWGMRLKNETGSGVDAHAARKATNRATDRVTDLFVTLAHQLVLGDGCTRVRRGGL